VGEFLDARWQGILFRSYQHTSLVVQAIILATVIALALAVLVTNYRPLAPVANALPAIGLTIPGLALLGLMIPLVGIGTLPSVIIVVFYAVLPILRNAVVGLQAVSPDLVEAARGQGMSSVAVFFRVRLPLAWPVIITGIRVSAQMSMGVAAIAAYAWAPDSAVTSTPASARSATPTHSTAPWSAPSQWSSWLSSWTPSSPSSAG